MLRINHSHCQADATLELDGKLIGPWVAELRRTVDSLRAHGSIHLRLHHLSFADPDGLRLLSDLRRSGIEIVGETALIEGLMASLTDMRGESNSHQRD